MEYNKLSDEIIAKLQALVGVQNVVTGKYMPMMK